MKGAGKGGGGGWVLGEVRKDRLVELSVAQWWIVGQHVE